MTKSGIEVAFLPHVAEGLQEAKPADLDVRSSPSGLGLHFPKLDTDIYLPALLEGLLGSQHWWQQGGRVKSAAKAAAARENGRLGGHPRKPFLA